MKELEAVTGNIAAVPLNGTFQAMAEIAIIVTEPQYQHDGSGRFVKIRQIETLRFSTGADGIKAVIQSLEEMLRECSRINEVLCGIEFKSEAEQGGEKGHA